MTAERSLLLTDWDNIDPFVLEYTRPDSQFPAPYPGKPFLMVDGIDVEPFVEDKMRPEPNVPPKYVHGPVAKIKYKIFTAFTMRTSIGADFITYPSAALEWAVDIPGSPRSLGDDVQAGVRSLNKEHTLTWKRVKTPPWVYILFALGKVNAAEFIGAQPECLLFNGVEATRDYTGLGTTLWTLEYKFSEKNSSANPFSDAEQKGWNHFLRHSVTPIDFHRVQFRDSGAPIYRLADFTRLVTPGIPSVDEDPLEGLEPEHPEI